MFGFSLQKLLVLAGIIAAIWYGFKLVGRLDAARKAEAKVADTRKPRWRPFRRSGSPEKGSGRRAEEARDDPEDMIACPACGAYVAPRSVTNCGRAECPY